MSLFVILCEIKKLLYFTCIFYTCVYVFVISVTGIYRLIQSCCYLNLQLIDSSQVEFVVLGNIFVMACFYVTLSTLFSLCFVTDCQRRSLLGSKEVGTNVLEFLFVMLANHDQNVLILFRLAQSMCFYVKLESSYCRIYCVNLSSSIN